MYIFTQNSMWWVFCCYDLGWICILLPFIWRKNHQHQPRRAGCSLLNMTPVFKLKVAECIECIFLLKIPCGESIFCYDLGWIRISLRFIWQKNHQHQLPWRAGCSLLNMTSVFKFEVAELIDSIFLFKIPFVAFILLLWCYVEFWISRKN